MNGVAMQTETTSGLPLYARVALRDPAKIERALDRIRSSGRVRDVPNTWQIFLGVLRMWHRMIFRSETVGTSSEPVRKTWRARLFSWRPLRAPFLLAEQAIAPLDFSGLLSTRERVIKHLLGAHHDENQFTYDLEMLTLFDEPGCERALDELHRRLKSVVSLDSRRTRYLRDLTVYSGYHEQLSLAVEEALAGRSFVSEAERLDPDITFFGYLAWCARQPPNEEETLAAWRQGRYSVAEGIRC